MGAVDATSMLWQVIYYSQNTNIYPLYWAFLIISFTFTLSLAVLLPESPKFFFARGKFQETRQSLRKIAKFNKVKDFTKFDYIKFDNEAILQENDEVNNQDQEDGEYLKKEGVDMPT